MAFFYVKSGSTGTGDQGRYATQQTGTFAALGATGAYGSISAAYAATTPPVSGDFIFVSDLHNFNNTVTSNWLYTSAVNTQLFIASVSDTAIDQYSAGAVESWNDGQDLDVDGTTIISGIDLSIGDDLVPQAGTRLTLSDCDVTLSGAGDQININVAGAYVRMINCTLTTVATNGNTGINLNNGGFEMIGGSLVNGGAALTNFIRAGSNGNLSARLVGVDMTTVTGTIVANFGATDGDDFGMFRFEGCAKADATDWTNEAFGYPGQRLFATNCAGTSAAGVYQFYDQQEGATVESQDSTGIIRDESQPFEEAGEKISFQVITNTNISVANPFIFDMPSTDVDLSNAASDVITVYVFSTVALTDNDIWVEMHYPDGTNENIYNRISTQNADIIGAGTALTTDGSSTWLDNGIPALGNAYQIDIDTSGNPGANCVPIFRVNCAIASTTIYVDTSVGVS